MVRSGSVVVAVAASDGLALAADRRTTEQSGEPPLYRAVSDSAEKVFLAEERLGIATYGLADIEGRSVGELLEEFNPSPLADVEQYARELGPYFYRLLSDATPPRRGEYVRVSELRWPLGFVVAGFDEAGVGRFFDVKVRPTGSRIEASSVTTDNPGVVQRGQADAIERLLEGVDWSLIKKADIKLGDEERERLRLFRYDLVLPTSVPDAVSLAEFLVETQIRMQAVSNGTYEVPTQVPGCGGLVRSLGVTRGGALWGMNPGEAVLARAAAVEPGRAAHGHAPRSA